jgi:hypothetical protein
VSGLDLGPQEAGSPRRMAQRQAQVLNDGAGLTVIDLESPGGTFVNRQRILSGEKRRLQEGDVIQVGGVQLRVVQSEPQTDTVKPPARPATSPAPPKPTAVASPPAKSAAAEPFSRPFRLATGATCRSWDDFLTVSAQNWPGLREELSSGRLSAYLRTQNRTDLLPNETQHASADERLDAWLARLPTTREALPDLDVHPAVVKVRAVAGGGVTRQKVVVTNTGYRLLRSTVRVESPKTDWMRVDPRYAGQPFVTPEQSEIAIEVQIPETVTTPLRAVLLVESNGGSRRVEVRIDPPLKAEPIPEVASAAVEPLAIAAGLSERIAAMSSVSRAVTGGLGALMARVVLAAGDRISGMLCLAEPGTPMLGGSAVLLAVLGGMAAVRWVLKRGEGRDVPSAAFAGAFSGVLTAALAVASCRSIEPLFGSLASSSTVFACALWLVLGGLAGWMTTLVLPRTQPLPGGEGAAS